jgi:hypothetical protein
MAVPQFRRLVTSLSKRRPRFAPRLVHVGSIVDKVALGQVYLWVLHFPPVSIILPLFHNHLSGQTTGPLDARSTLQQYKKQE